jgi:glucoamylase
MRRLRGAVGLVALLVIGAALTSGGSGTDLARQRYLPGANALKTVARFGSERTVTVRSLGVPDAVHADPRWLAAARPLGREAPGWALRMYAQSLLVLHALTDERTGAVLAGAREGWAYVWPRDASTVAMALAAAGYRGEARRIVHFLRGLDLGAAARFHGDGAPVDGRAAQGDATGWIAAAARAAELPSAPTEWPWRGLSDYQESDGGDFIANAIASSAPNIRALFGTPAGTLSRRAGDSRSGSDSAAAWAVRPFPRPALYPLVRPTLLRLSAASGRFGIVPSEDWDGGVDPWTAPTAWTAWSLAALGERDAVLHLMAELRRAATPTGMLPERIDARTGVPTSTTPLAWSHAFAILALRQLWPRTASTSSPSR